MYGSRTTAAVRPTPELPFPVVYTPRGAKNEICLSNCDFAIPGSPNNATFIYPLIFKLSGVVFVTPPVMSKSNAFLTDYRPYIYGAIDRDNF